MKILSLNFKLALLFVNKFIREIDLAIRIKEVSKVRYNICFIFIFIPYLDVVLIYLLGLLNRYFH